MRRKYILILSIALLSCLVTLAQFEPPALGSVSLSTTTTGKSSGIGRSTLPLCTPENYACNTPASLSYTFIGSGDWNNPENWLNNLIPPGVLPAGLEIIVTPHAGTECILNVPQTIATGARLTIVSGKKLRVIDGATVQ